MKKVCFVGGGNMASAMLAGLRKAHPALVCHIIEPFAPARDKLAATGVTVYATAERAAVDGADAVVLAVKPQMLEGVAREAARFAAAKPVFVSIAAGVSLARLQSFLGDTAAIVRAMPNLPASIGAGVTVAAANGLATKAQRRLAGALLTAAGDLEWLEDETPIDAVTAVSGSGPAYVFLLVETLAAAGVEAGLAPDLAMRLARRTIVGSGALLSALPDQAAEKLRRDVTSPGGTTEAALGVLMAAKGLAPLMAKAVKAAVKRARELGR